MTWRELEISPENRERLLQGARSWAETENFETKRVSGKMVGKALETVCAFANTRGGILFLGVDDAARATGKDRFYGIEENKEAVDELLRKLNTHFHPEIEGIRIVYIPCELRDGNQGRLLLVNIPQSDKVHSILDDGTWMRGQASNREMTASEITELSYQRGMRSAESEPVEVDFELLDTPVWRLFLQGRGLAATGIANQLFRIGLAEKVKGKLRPRRAAVLLFADYPGALLAATGTRADLRVFHYRGNAIVAGEVPNLVAAPKTLSGPLYRLIGQACAYILELLAEGLTLAESGFRTVHRYPERVIKEAITNALIHRDYRLNQDVHVRIFDNRVEIISPGLFPGRITADTIGTSGSFARNPLIAANLREFPEPPNVDAGEGVRMMFQVMKAENLFPPQYQQQYTSSSQAIILTLRNEEPPPEIWEQVNDWLNRKGSIRNSELRQIAGIDTLAASKLLKRWVEQGLLDYDPGSGKRNRVYSKPLPGTKTAQAGTFLNLLSEAPDKES